MFPFVCLVSRRRLSQWRRTVATRPTNPNNPIKMYKTCYGEKRSSADDQKDNAKRCNESYSGATYEDEVVIRPIIGQHNIASLTFFNPIGSVVASGIRYITRYFLPPTNRLVGLRQIGKKWLLLQWQPASMSPISLVSSFLGVSILVAFPQHENDLFFQVV
ncbi:putative WRKY transcription factor 70-like protein [Corchorus olitorius]|uniref:WRKY transcription factor 70-like protein n=1 Tax=Corchorus olitorius TaxID=93759 RepID=A0A1R3H6V1_9ROSI|nr:putative WRKY transcription factor 70-like protein [Corchorus olitorius]